MKRFIASSVLIFIGAVGLFAYGLSVAVPTLIAAAASRGEAGYALSVFYAVIFTIDILAAFGFGLAGGILNVKGRKGGFVFVLISLLAVFEYVIPLSFAKLANLGIYGIGRGGETGVLIARTALIAVYAASLVIMPKGKGAYNLAVLFFSLLTAMMLGFYTYYEKAGAVYTIVFALFGVAGAVLSAVEAVRVAKGGKGSLNLMVLALLAIAGQYIGLCTMCTQINGLVHLVLGMSSIILVIAGGVLIADSNESGFIIVSLGIIAALVWLFLLAVFVNAAIALGLVCIAVCLALLAGLALKGRAKQGV
ncbi:MAG: hypothetical protein K2J61_03100 [Clostridia bacterium]|nr:hypothetical protein [Clostridia bacterium]